MSYTPNNATVYLRAFSGCQAGMSASGRGQGVADLSADEYYAQMADAWAQAVDAAFGAVTPTLFELSLIEDMSETIWTQRSPLPTSVAFNPAAYAGLALVVTTAATTGNAQVVAVGIDPNAGGGGGGGGGGLKTAAFTFATASPLVLSAITAGANIGRVGIAITTTFDGAGAALTVGTPFSPSLLLGASDNSPGAIGQYESDAVTKFAAPDTLELSITPGAGATQGAGFVYYSLST